MAAMHFSKGALASTVLVFLMLSIMAMSCAMLAITNRQLYNAWTACLSSPYGTSCYNAAQICWISSSPLNEMVPCSYLYAVGALGLFFPMLACTAVCLVDTFKGTLAIGLTGAVCNFIWWIAGAIYFQIQVKDINNLPLAIPQDEYRTDIIALLWTNMGVSVVMILIVLFMAKEAKRYQMAKAEANAQHIPEAKMVVGDAA